MEASRDERRDSVEAIRAKRIFDSIYCLRSDVMNVGSVEAAMREVGKMRSRAFGFRVSWQFSAIVVLVACKIP
jgi:hypothetical protein